MSTSGKSAQEEAVRKPNRETAKSRESGQNPGSESPSPERSPSRPTLPSSKKTPGQSGRGERGRTKKLPRQTVKSRERPKSLPSRESHQSPSPTPSPERSLRPTLPLGKSLKRKRFTKEETYDISHYFKGKIDAKEIPTLTDCREFLNLFAIDRTATKIQDKHRTIVRR